jgi:hypothetical protein
MRCGIETKKEEERKRERRRCTTEALMLSIDAGEFGNGNRSRAKWEG